MTTSKKTHAVKGKSGATAKKPATKSHDVAEKSTHAEKEPVVTINRRDSRERRRTGDRRTHQIPVAVEQRAGQRREKVSRRRQIDPTTCERDYTNDEIEFMSAMDNYKRRSGRMFPTCSEVLEVLKSLGYQKCPQPQIEPAAATTPIVALPTLDIPLPAMAGC